MRRTKYCVVKSQYSGKDSRIFKYEHSGIIKNTEEPLVDLYSADGEKKLGTLPISEIEPVWDYPISKEVI